MLGQEENAILSGEMKIQLLPDPKVKLNIYRRENRPVTGFGDKYDGFRK